MATVPEWVFKKITFHQTEEEMMAHPIMASKVTCLNNNAWHYECAMVIRVFVALYVNVHPDSIEIPPCLKESHPSARIKWKQFVCLCLYSVFMHLFM